MTAITNRLIGPESKTIDKIDFLPVSGSTLDNQIRVSALEAGSQEVTKIDFQFPAGSIQAKVPLLASTTANLMLEGTASRNSMEISETIDYYGAYLNTQTYHHQTVITLLCLTRHLPVLLELVEEIIKSPSFPEKEFDIFLEKKREEFLLENEKVNTMASRKFGETLFGDHHPYGRQLKPEHFDQITLDQVIRFHRDFYSPANCRIFVAGRPGKDLIPQLNKHFGSPQWASSHQPPETMPPGNPSEEKFILVEKNSALQSAVKIGRPLFNNHHPDFIPLQLLNTILGGYFGSRLMTSVREDKGLTYGIGSYIMPLKHGGIWVISSEVACKNRKKAVEAIFEEFGNLCRKPVPEEELEMVKNYMMGELLRNFDGPFSTADIYRNLQEFDLNFGFYKKMIEFLKQVTPIQLQELAKKYLNPDDFWVVVAGM